MSQFTPLDADDEVIPAGTAPTAAPAQPSSAPTTFTPIDHDDEVLPDQHPTAPAPQTQDQVNDHLRKLMDDPHTTGQQIRDFYTSLGGKLSEHDSAVLDGRDAYLKAHHRAPTVGIDVTHTAAASPGLTDNRPYSFGEGVSQGVQQVASNVAGGAGWLANKVGVHNDWGDNTRGYFSNLEAQQPTQGTGLGRIVGEVATAAPAMLAAAPIEAGAAALGAPALVAGGLGMLADGAIQGALTTHATTPGGVATDAAIGGTLGAGFGGAARGLSHLASTPTQAAVRGREVLNAADRLEGVRPLPADVGGQLTKGMNAAGEAGLVSNIPITRGADHYLDSLQAARDRAASRFLPAGAVPRDIDSAALHVLHAPGGLGDYEARSAEAGGRLYDDAAQMAAGTQIETPRTLAAVNALIDQAERTPGNTPGIEALRSLRDDLTPDADQLVPSSILDQHGNPIAQTVIPGARAEYAIDNLRRLRTSFGDNFDSGQRAAREAANTLWGPLSEDIQSGLRAQGRGDAADAYRAADQNWAQRHQHLDETVTPILAGRSHELLADKLVDMTRNDHALLNRGLALMSPEQAAQVRSALVRNLGRSKPGAQNAAGDGFSLHSFGTDWDKLSDGLKATMLNGQAGQDLQDLARLAEAAKASGRYRNTSGTARSLDALNLLRGGVSAVVGGAGAAAGGLATAGATLGAQFGLGHLLASPTVGRGIVRMGEVRPIAKSGAALAALARRVGPAISSDQP